MIREALLAWHRVERLAATSLDPSSYLSAREDILARLRQTDQSLSSEEHALAQVCLQLCSQNEHRAQEELDDVRLAVAKIRVQCKYKEKPSSHFVERMA